MVEARATTEMQVEVNLRQTHLVQLFAVWFPRKLL